MKFFILFCFGIILFLFYICICYMEFKEHAFYGMICAIFMAMPFKAIGYKILDKWERK
jgi:hypothetical protein